jgi:hypothetical protein
VGSRGTAIDEGVGYGGIRIGDPEATLQARWGLSPCRGPTGDELHIYGAIREADQAVELVMVRVDAGRIAAMTFLLAPHAGIARAIGFTTRAGIRAGMSAREVVQAYGPPEVTMDRIVLYVSHGVGFAHLNGRIVGIAIFAPGTRPDLSGMVY